MYEVSFHFMSKDFVLTSAVIAGAHSPNTTAAITSSLRTGVGYPRRRIGKAVDVLAPAASRVSYESTKPGVPNNYRKE